MGFEICCPKCGEMDMLSVEPVVKSFRVSFTNDGGLHFDTNVVNTWSGDDEPFIQCGMCHETFTRSEIKKQFEELKVVQ